MIIFSSSRRTAWALARALVGVACIVAGASAQSTPARPGGAAPTGITLSGAAGAVTVGWAAVAGAARYYVVRSDGATAKGTELGAPVSTTAFLDKTASAGMTYYYRVAAARADGRRDTSAAVAYTVPKPRANDTLRTRSPPATGPIGVDSMDAPHTRRITILLERELP
jgi:hypothetical protein